MSDTDDPTAGTQGDQTYERDETTVDDRTEQIPPSDATEQLPVREEPVRTQAQLPVDTPVTDAAAPGHEERPGAAAWPPPVPPRPTGPHAPAIVLGIVALAIAGIVLAQELGNLTVDWGDVGPLGFVAVGAVLVVLGTIGLVGSNRRGHRS